MKKQDLHPNLAITGYRNDRYNEHDPVRGDNAENMRKKIALNTGLVYLFTGDGKGKTSAALGMLLRALSHGWKVGWVSWYKQASWGISEHQFPAILKKSVLDRLQFVAKGQGFFLGKDNKKVVQAGNAVIVDGVSEEEHKKAGMDALKEAQQLLPVVDVLFLDEICNAIADKLILEEDVVLLLAKRKKTHIVLTGRKASQQLMQVADLVSEVKKIKHPFDVGIMAVKGLDF